MFKKIGAFICMNMLMVAYSVYAAEALVVGTNAEFPPFTFIEKGSIVGFDIDIANEVCSRLGKQMKLKDMPFDALIPEVVLGHVDFVAAGMSYTEERAKRVLFTKPYLSGDPLVILTKDNPTEPLTVESLIGKTVVVNEGFTADTYMSSQEGIHLVRLPTTADAFIALQSNRAYAFVTAQSTYSSYSAAKPNQFHQFPIAGTSETCALLVPKVKPELLSAIQGALDAMQQDGTIDTLKAKWSL